VWVYAGVVDEHVEGLGVGLHRQYGRGDGGRIGHVEGQQHEALGVLLVQLLQLGGLGGVPAGGEYLVAAL